MSRIDDVSAMTPQRADIEWRSNPDGTITLQKRRFGAAAAKLLAMAKLPPTLDVHLDSLGTRVWELMDGRTVGDILQVLQEEFPGEDDLATRLGQYLGTLVSNDLVELN